MIKNKKNKPIYQCEVSRKENFKAIICHQACKRARTHTKMYIYIKDTFLFIPPEAKKRNLPLNDTDLQAFGILYE